MTSFDYLVLAILGLSVALSVMRGLVLEALSIVSWVLAFIVAKSYASQLVPMMPEPTTMQTNSAVPTNSAMTLVNKVGIGFLCEGGKASLRIPNSG